MKHLVNRNLIALAKQAQMKTAFVSGDAAAGGAAGGAPPMDPMAGGAPPMDPMAGGAPPMDPMAGGDPMAALQPMIDQAVQTAMASQGGGSGGGSGGGEGGIKPKIDVNVELMQIKNMLAKMTDAMGIQIPAQEMVATEQSLNAMAANPGAAPGGAPGGSAIQPIEPIQAAAPAEKVGSEYAFNNGAGYTPTDSDKLEGIGAQASYVLSLLNR